MASFTDLIPKFNPYIQQLPVEAMVAVGMDKQRRYEEGVQRIQAQISQVAGLSVLRPQDKQYLQSKLNELGNNLKGVAAGDFSNFQLVNSVGGMVSQISRDPFIRAAVKSTALDQENLEFMDKERASGKLTPQNEYFYNLQKKKYLDAGLADESGNPISFSGRYIAHRDVKAKLKELAKEVGVDENLVQNMYNADGTLNKVMVETLTKGKDASKIYSAFINGLGPEDYQQLAIDGIYKYKGNDAASMIDIFKASNDDFVATGNNKLADLKTEIYNLIQKKASVKTPEDLAVLNKQIASLEALSYKISDSIFDSNKTFDELQRGINFGDEDYLNGVKGKLYTNNFLKNLSKDFAESTSHVKNVENPLFKAIMEENKFTLDNWYKQQQVKLDWAKVQEQKEANRLKAEENFLKKQELTPGTLPTPGGLPGPSISKVDLINSENSANVAKRNELLRTLGVQEMRKVFGDKMEQWVKDQVKTTGKSPEEVIEAYGIKVLTDINDRRIKPAPENVEMIQRLNRLNNVVSGMTSLIDAADKEAYGIAGFGDIQGINDRNGRELFSGKELLDVSKIVSKAKKTEQVSGVLGGSMFAVGSEGGKVSLDVNQVLKGVAGNPKKLAIATAMIKKHQGVPLSDVEKVILSRTEQVQSITQQKQDIYNREKERIYSEKFTGFFPNNQAVTLTDKSRPIFKANLTAAIGDRPEFAKAISLLNEDGSQVFFSVTPSLAGINVSGSSKITLSVFGKKGEKQDVEITPVQYAYLLGKNPDEVDPEITLALTRVNFSPDGSSNKKGISVQNIPLSFFKAEDFRNIKDYDVKGGDYIVDAANPDVFYPKIYLTPNGQSSPVIINVRSPMSIREVLDFPRTLTESHLRQLINLQ